MKHKEQRKEERRKTIIIIIIGRGDEGKRRGKERREERSKERSEEVCAARERRKPEMKEGKWSNLSFGEDRKEVKRKGREEPDKRERRGN